jgi:hypothetical protein
MSFKGAAVTVQMSTTNAGDYRKGLVVTADVALTEGSEVAGMLKALLNADMKFSLDLFVPVFGNIAQGTEIALQTPEIPIKGHDNLKFAGVRIAATLGVPLQLSLAGGMAVKFKSTPNWLSFVVEGVFRTDGSFSVMGGMDGVWNNIFGLKGLDVGDAWIEADFVASAPMLAGLGLGANITFGNDVFAMDGHVDLANPTDIFFMAKVESFSLLNLALAYNEMVPNHPLNISNVPNLFLVHNALIKIAPEDGELNIDGMIIKFSKGLDIDALVTVVQIGTIHVHIHNPQDSTTFIPDIIMDFDMTFGGDKKKKFMAIMHSMFDGQEFLPLSLQKATTTAEVDQYLVELSHILPVIKDLDIDDISFMKLAEGIFPKVTVDVSAFGKDYHWSKQLNFFQLLERLGDLIKKGVIDIKTLLEQPHCAVNTDCNQGEVCSHHGDEWQCLATCENDSGEVPLFGCVSCVSDAECMGANGGGCCSNEGKCVSSREEGRYCGMCYDWLKPEDKCQGNGFSGCEFDFCTFCADEFDCMWYGSEGWSCQNGSCQMADPFASGGDDPFDPFSDDPFMRE